MIISGTVNATNIAASISSGLASPTTTRWKWHKTPTPTPNGSQLVFTLPNSEAYVSGTLRIYLDGLRQIKDTDYAETTANTFTMTVAPNSDETFSIDYLMPA